MLTGIGDCLGLYIFIDKLAETIIDREQQHTAMANYAVACPNKSCVPIGRQQIWQNIVTAAELFRSNCLHVRRTASQPSFHPAIIQKCYFNAGQKN